MKIDDLPLIGEVEKGGDLLINKEEQALVGLLIAAIACIFTGDEQSFEGFLTVLDANADKVDAFSARLSGVGSSPEANMLMERARRDDSSVIQQVS